MSSTRSFEVYLTEAEHGDFGGESPIRAETVDFYDSGVWVSHGEGRDFFPYERVRRIREMESNTGSGERRDAAGGAAGSVDDTELDVE